MMVSAIWDTFFEISYIARIARTRRAGAIYKIVKNISHINAWWWVQYGIHFSRFFILHILHEPVGRVQYIKSRKIYPILHEQSCVNLFITWECKLISRLEWKYISYLYWSANTSYLHSSAIMRYICTINLSLNLLIALFCVQFRVCVSCCKRVCKRVLWCLNRERSFL